VGPCLAPSNPIKAAAEDAILPLVVFSIFLGFAANPPCRDDLKLPWDLFRAVAEAMIVIVRWVLWAAPFGGVRAGARGRPARRHRRGRDASPTTCDRLHAIAGSTLIAIASGVGAACR
jgi:hypothetical protein